MRIIRFNIAGLLECNFFFNIQSKTKRITRWWLWVSPTDCLDTNLNSQPRKSISWSFKPFPCWINLIRKSTTIPWDWKNGTDGTSPKWLKLLLIISFTLKSSRPLVWDLKQLILIWVEFYRKISKRMLRTHHRSLWVLRSVRPIKNISGHFVTKFSKWLITEPLFKNILRIECKLWLRIWQQLSGN